MEWLESDLIVAGAVAGAIAGAIAGAAGAAGAGAGVDLLLSEEFTLFLLPCLSAQFPSSARFLVVLTSVSLVYSLSTHLLDDPDPTLLIGDTY